MKRKIRLNFVRGDILAILLVIVAAAAVMAAYIPNKEADAQPVLQIWQDGRLVREESLDKPVKFEITGEYTNVIAVEKGSVCIIESDCPGSDCVHSGRINQPGRSIVCLPNRVEVRITGSSEVDFAVG